VANNHDLILGLGIYLNTPLNTKILIPQRLALALLTHRLIILKPIGHIVTVAAAPRSEKNLLGHQTTNLNLLDGMAHVVRVLLSHAVVTLGVIGPIVVLAEPEFSGAKIYKV
jgi:hypothetical protein